ncbi:phosphatase PAP2 family protein [Cesiribacter andamanensis]|uniref:PAP2 superfamily protein n=1 Tax=Cesiribacter andamanensis AMV16 TaxID=1279009 RepID=M7NYG4_9BACT|nr:phosphatase PAP2 family protein [Cesiribacter andamanensis]EMR03429.1 PAP2 superfamily protein [Cesiribacter andamanensis AMV16]
MKRFSALFISCYLLAALPLIAQDSGATTTAPTKVYKTSWTDGVISAAGIGMSAWGLSIMNAKDPLSEEYLDWVALYPEQAKANVPKFDRWAAGNFDARISDLTDIPFYGSFGLPLVVALGGERTRKDFWQIGLLYLETMSITGTFYTHSAGWLNRHRPLVYNADPDNDDRTDIKATNSFFAGHTAATASATFFAAKVFNDYYPNSRARAWVWAGAAIIPAAVGAGRLHAGKHFLSDNLVGYALGASIGILVPHLHKVSGRQNFSLMPISGPYDGLALQYRF